MALCPSSDNENERVKVVCSFTYLFVDMIVCSRDMDTV